MPILVENKNQIIVNLRTIERYLMNDSHDIYDAMAKYIARGKVFIAYAIGGQLHFAPSRFVGYANNSLVKHKNNDEKHGTKTTQAISRILDQSNEYVQEFEKAYQTYCNWLGEKPSNKARSFWRLEEIPLDIEETHFFEGGRRLVSHIVRERNGKAVSEAKDLFKKKHDGELFCEICGFNFKSVYGNIGDSFIEAHHKVGIASTDDEYEIKPSDFLMVCSNCHSMLHRGNVTIEELKHRFK